MTPVRWSVRSLRTKIIVSTVLVMAIAVVLMGVAVQLVLNELVSTNVDRVLSDRAEAVAGAVEASSQPDGGLTVPPGAIEGGVVVFDSSGVLVAGGLPEGQEERAAALATSRQRTTTQVGERARLLAVPFETSSSLSAVVVVSERLAPYEQAETYVLYATALLGVLVMVGAGFLASWVTQRALAPVGQMSAQAVEWGDRDLDRRFDLGAPRDEITGLGAALDILLDRVALALLAEQRLTSELAHELRTPLTALQATADLALLNDDLSTGLRLDLEQITLAARRMGMTITTLLEVARSSAGSTGGFSATVGEVFDRLLSTMSPGRSVAMSFEGLDRSARLGISAELATRAVAPVLENAQEHAAGGIRVTTQTASNRVDIRIHDDGPGLPDIEVERVFEPGATRASTGAGLGLPLARRIARSAGGDVFAEPSSRGAIFVVRLPSGAAAPDPQSGNLQGA